MKTKKKKQLSPQLIKLLRRVRAIILKRPDRFDMNQDTAINRCGIKGCGTPQCIVGWMRVIYRGKQWVGELFPDAYVRERLYYASQWPKQFLQDPGYPEYDWSKIQAKTAAKRITHFIKTDGRE